MAYTKYTPFANGDSGLSIREKLNALGESVNAIGDGTKTTVDNTKAPINHASTNMNTYGKGSITDYGHVALSNAIDRNDLDETTAVASTPKAVKIAYDKAVEALTAVGTLTTQLTNGTVIVKTATNATNATTAGTCSGRSATCGVSERSYVDNVGNCRFIWDGTNLNITTG